VVELLGAGEDLPPKLRGAVLVETGGGFFYRTSDGELLPRVIGDDLRQEWSDEGETVANVAAPNLLDHAAHQQQQAGAPDSSPLRKPFGLDDMGPLTVPEASVPETLDARLQPLGQSPAAPAAEPSPQAGPMRSDSLFGQLQEALHSVRRQAAMGELNLETLAPTMPEMESLVAGLLAGPPAEERLARLYQRSLKVASLIEEAWAEEEGRERRELHRDLASNTLMLIAVNPAQLKDTDLLGLANLLKAQRSGVGRPETELARELRTRALDRVKDALRSGLVSDAVLQAARASTSLVSGGKLQKEAVSGLVAATVLELASKAIAEVLGEQRALGIAVPGLAEWTREQFQPLAYAAGERAAQALP
jgi:hypothetical protein